MIFEGSKRVLLLSFLLFCPIFILKMLIKFMSIRLSSAQNIGMVCAITCEE